MSYHPYRPHHPRHRIEVLEDAYRRDLEYRQIEEARAARQTITAQPKEKTDVPQ